MNRQLTIKYMKSKLAESSCLLPIQLFMYSSTADLVLLHFTLLCFADNRDFYKLNVCGNPTLSKSISAIFPTAFSHFMFLCHILVILVIFQTFSLLLYLLWWPVISNLWCITALIHWRLRWWLAFFTNKVFLN